jgi:hypothetical protein
MLSPGDDQPVKDPVSTWRERIARRVFGPRRAPRQYFLDRLQNRTTIPVAGSVKRAIETFDKMLDRQFAALEAADRKAELALTALIGLGLLSSTDLLKPPADQPFIAILVVGALSGLGAVVMALNVLLTRTMLIGPDAVPTAEATYYSEVALDQSVADSLAVAITVNKNVLETKTRRLNLSIGAATVAVVAFFIVTMFGRTNVETSGAHSFPSPSAPAEAPATSNVPSATASPVPTDSPLATASPVTTQTPGLSPSVLPSGATPPGTDTGAAAQPDAVAFVHPRLGLAELREGWDSRMDPPIPGPEPEVAERVGEHA